MLTARARVKRLLDIAAHVRDTTGISFDFIDLGGGFGVPYHPEEKGIDLEAFCRTLFTFIKDKIGDLELGRPEIWLEPGRYIVAESGIILTRVTTLKMSPGKTFVGVDAGFNTLIRPAMYGSYHHIHNASRLNNDFHVYDVYGPLCESGDIFARGRSISKIEEGDLLAIMNTGAYGFSMASNYNSRLKPAEVILKAGKPRVIRERETLKDLLRGQSSAHP
jgi:diaminopimelate decarboxylase